MKSNIARIILVFFLFLSSLPNFAFAETKTFIKEYTYQAGDEDSKNSSRTIALREVKRLLLEELGTYLESETEVKNFQLTKDQIVTLTAGIVRTELIEEKWNTQNLQYWLKAKITANPQDVTKAIDNLRKDRAKVKELEELRKRSEELLRENERLTKELKTAKDDARKEAAQAYKQNIDNLSATEWLERGLELFRSGNETEAEKAFGKAIELNPQYADAYILRGSAYVDLGDYQKAIEDLNKAIELNPKDAGAHYLRGIVYGRFANYRQAIKDYNKAIELNPKHASAYINRGDAYNDLGNHQQAIKDYSRAIKLNTKDAEAYFNRGNTYGRLSDYQQSIKDYNKAIELNPQYADAYYNRGFEYGKLGNYQQAIEDCNKVIELNPKHAEAYNSRGLYYINLGNYQQAIKDYMLSARTSITEKCAST